MKILLSTFIICCLIFPALSQDVIFTTDGGRVEAKVLEIKPDEIRYKKNSNPDGPDYTISKSDVLVITYANGSHETFASYTRSYSGRGKPFDSLTTKYGRNYITYNTIDLLRTNMTFAYERILGKGHLGIRIPLTVGFGNSLDYYYGIGSGIGKGTIMASGLDLNLYPSGQGKLRYFLAPSFLITSFYYFDYDNYYNKRKMGVQYAALIKHGLVMQVTPSFNMSVVLGLGISQNQTDNYDYTQVKGSFEYNVGYRF